MDAQLLNEIRVKASQANAKKKEEAERKAKLDKIKRHTETVEDFYKNVFLPEALRQSETGCTFPSIKYPTTKHLREFLEVLAIRLEKEGFSYRWGTDKDGNGMMDRTWEVLEIKW